MNNESEGLSRRRRKEIASLVQKKYRERLGELLVEGVRSVEAAVEAGAPLVEVVVSEEAVGAPRVAELLVRCPAPVHVLPHREVEALSDVQASQGVLAVARAVLVPERQLTEGAAAVLILDGVQDPGNVGTIVRAAAWFGADAVVAGPGTADLFNPKVVRAAMGGLWDLHLVRSTDLGATLSRLGAAGFHLYGADLEGTRARDWTPQVPSVLVLGSEAHGLSPAAAEALHERVAITGPSSGRRSGVESLNVGIAAGILLYMWRG